MQDHHTMSSPRARPLRAIDFKPNEKPAITASPAVVKIGSRFAISITNVFSAFASAAPRVTLDHIVEQVEAPAGDETTWLRLETRAGSANFCIRSDRQVIFALCELALGGAGTEPPFDDSGRPLSAIEAGLDKIFVDKLADELVGVISSQLDTPASIFAGPAAPAMPDPDPEGASAFVSFKYLINIHGYSGELLLIADRNDLAAQIAATQTAAGHDLQQEQGRDAFRRRVAEAASDFHVAFPPETMQVRDIIALKPGKLLRLSATMASTVTVSCGGSDIYSAVLVPAADRLAVRLIEPSQ